MPQLEPLILLNLINIGKGKWCPGHTQCLVKIGNLTNSHTAAIEYAINIGRQVGMLG